MKSIENIKIWIVDVDGTMTDGGIYYDEQGNEYKKFCSRDAAAFFCLQKLGMKTMILTGRACKATERRARELGVDYLEQGVKDKESYLKNHLAKNQMDFSQVAYIGDDINDFPIMRRCGFKGCPIDSCKEIVEIADYVSTVQGGYGAVREIVEHVLREAGLWEQLVSKIYNI